jgi:alpha-glucosidase
LTRRLLELRAAEPVLQDGTHERLVEGPTVVAYGRRGAARRLLVVLNFAHAPETFSFPGETGSVRLNTFLDREGEPVDGQVRLRADEGVVLALDASSASRAA